MDELERGVPELRERRGWLARAAASCGPALLLLTGGAVLGGMMARNAPTPPLAPPEPSDARGDGEGTADANGTATTPLLPASDPNCDHLLAESGPRVVETRLCVNHSATVNFASPLSTPPDQTDSSLSFLVIGDWGRDGMCCQRDVAIEMGRAATQTKAAFIINTGDNFYPAGIQDRDAEQVGTSWRQVYDEPGIDSLVWYNCLGNHDWYGNAQAQLDLHGGRWHLPSHYYDIVLPADADNATSATAHFVFLDTTPTLPSYAGFATVSDFWRDYETSPAAYLDKQIAFLRTAFAGSSATWRFVVGHHPIYTSSEHYFEDHVTLRTALSPVLDELGVAAYFNGHDHGLEVHAPPSSNTMYILSGGGSQVRPPLSARDEGFQFHFAAWGGFLSVSLNDTFGRVQLVDMTGALLSEFDLFGPVVSTSP